MTKDEALFVRRERARLYPLLAKLADASFSGVAMLADLEDAVGPYLNGNKRARLRRVIAELAAARADFDRYQEEPL